MNLKDLITLVKVVSTAYPTIQEFEEGDIYSYLNSGEHKYPTIFLTIESISTEGDTQNLNATLFYVDRLLNDSSNKIDVQTVAITALKSIIEKLSETNYINFTSINYTPFTEKFADLCAGAFAQCSIQVNDELECSDDYELSSLSIIENGVYDVLGYKQAIVNVKGSDPNSVGAYDGKIKINDYLYSISYSNIDYADAIKYFESLTIEKTGACSFIREKNKIGRNFDWTINKQVEFLVKTPNTGKHYSVTGIAIIEGITTDNIGNYNEDFKYLPFRLLDGINERGLVCSVNQLPQSDKTINKNGTIPTEGVEDSVSMFMLTRYILDNFESALEAADYIKKHIKVMPILDKNGNALDFHYCIADKDNTVYLYFENEQVLFEEKTNDKFVMTNFRLAGTTLVDGHYSITDSNIEEFGQGIERANSLIDSFDLDEVVFTKAYTTTDRLTDFTGIEGATISDTEKLLEIQARAAIKFDQEQAAGSLRTSADLWQTVHSVEYDLNNLSIIVKNQEIEGGDADYEFKPYSAEPAIKGKDYQIIIDSIPLNIVAGTRNVSSTTGEFVSSTTAHHYSNEIELQGNETNIKFYTFNFVSNYGYAFLTADGTFIEGVKTTANEWINIDPTDAYKRGARKFRATADHKVCEAIEITRKVEVNVVDIADEISNYKFGHYNTIGSPQQYTCPIETEGLERFNNYTDIYNAYDALATQYPQYFKREDNIGRDASGNYVIRRYTLGWQYPLVSANRAGTDPLPWDATKYKYRRIMVVASIHSDETWATLGAYLAIKEILDSNEPWAMFIKNNFILDILPLANPWGYGNHRWSSKNANGVNLNRTYIENREEENIAIIDHIQSIKDKGLIGIIDCHGTSDGNGYLVAKPSYKHWNYYAVLAQQIAAIIDPMAKQVFGTAALDNNFHLWDASENGGQLHEYADKIGILGCTFEVKHSAAAPGSLLTKAIMINLINAFGTYEGE